MRVYYRTLELRLHHGLSLTAPSFPIQHVATWTTEWALDSTPHNPHASQSTTIVRAAFAGATLHAIAVVVNSASLVAPSATDVIVPHLRMSLKSVCLSSNQSYNACSSSGIGRIEDARLRSIRLRPAGRNRNWPKSNPQNFCPEP